MKRLKYLGVGVLIVLGAVLTFGSAAFQTPVASAAVLATVTSTPLPITPDPDADQTVQEALANFAAADTFRLQASNALSPNFFGAEYTPAPGDDPDKVNLFTIFGEQSEGNINYTLTGFLASFIGLFSGFDPNHDELTVLRTGDDLYMRGVLDGETEPQWYAVSPEEASNSDLAPQEMFSPMTNAEYPEGSFSRVGDASFHGMACSVYEGNRDAFDAVFPLMVRSSLVNEDAVTLDSIDTFLYQLTICPDGNLYQAQYNFEGTSAADPDEEGFFQFGAQLTDYEFDINIEAPEDAIPLPASPFSSSATPDATTTMVAPQDFTTLNGEWEGTIGDDSPISFTVEDEAVTYASINYSISDGGCSTSGTLANSVQDAAISDDEFTFTLTDSDDVEYIVNGTFDSNNEASGTLNIKGETFCGDTDETMSWTAQHISSPDMPAVTATTTVTATVRASSTPTRTVTRTPTRAVTRTATRTPTRAVTRTPTRIPPTRTATTVPTVVPTTAGPSGAQIVEEALGAFSRRDINGALSYFDDNISYNLAGTAGVGKANLQSMLQLGMMFGTNFAVSNVQQNGENVTFTVVVTGMGAGTYPNSTAVIRNGKVVELNIR